MLYTKQANLIAENMLTPQILLFGGGNVKLKWD